MPDKVSTNALTSAILAGITERFHGRIVAWRNNRLVARAIGRGGKIRTVSAGIDGQADITGIILTGSCGGPRAEGSGIRLEIEIKAGDDKQNAAQIGFQKMIESHGGIYLIAKDATKCLDSLKWWLDINP